METIFFANVMGPQGLLVVFALVLLFGAKKLPGLARGLGQAIREFKRGKNGDAGELAAGPDGARPPITGSGTPKGRTSQSAPDSGSKGV